MTEYNRKGYKVLDQLYDNEFYVGDFIYPLRYNIKLDQLVPNPTIFWLESDKYHAQISNLERDGLIGKWESELAKNPEKLDLFSKQHQRYRDFRWNLLIPEHQEYVIQKGWKSKFESGIGGIRNWDSIKCLHLHFAHYCHNRDNIIGQMVKQTIDI